MTNHNRDIFKESGFVCDNFLEGNANKAKIKNMWPMYECIKFNIVCNVVQYNYCTRECMINCIGIIIILN